MIEEDAARALVRVWQGDTEALKALAIQLGPQAAELFLPKWAKVALRAGKAAVDELAAGGLITMPAMGGVGSPSAQDFPYASPGYGRFISWLEAKFDYGMGLLIGDTGQGKTNALCKLSDHLPIHRRLVVGYPESALVEANEIIQAQGGVPLEAIDWSLHKLNSLPKGCGLIMPDMGLFLDSRAWGQAPDEVFGYLLILARHRDIPMLGDLQYTSGVGLRALMSKFTIRKQLPENWEALERGSLFKHAIEAMMALGAVPARDRIGYGHVRCASADFTGLAPITLAPYYTPALAKARADFDILGLEHIQRKMRWGFADGEEEEDAEFREVEPD